MRPDPGHLDTGPVLDCSDRWPHACRPVGACPQAFLSPADRPNTGKTRKVDQGVGQLPRVDGRRPDRRFRCAGAASTRELAGRVSDPAPADKKGVPGPAAASAGSVRIVAPSPLDWYDGLHGPSRGPPAVGGRTGPVVGVSTMS